jgi:hypothetical protein
MDLMCLKQYGKYHHKLLTTLSEAADDGDCMLDTIKKVNQKMLLIASHHCGK